MKLYIDTSNTEKIIVGIDNQKFETSAKKEKAQRLLPFIYEALKKKKRSLQDLAEIQVNTGPGSFTGLRVGVSVANALGWSLGIPVNGKNLRKGEFVEINYSG
jgi:tRNA threonylcarbamoyladenosine biosynthesis protein TsaB